MKCIISTIFLLLFSLTGVNAQYSDLEKSIAAHRKGIITVKAKPNANVQIEQLRHEFWFGCALSTPIFNGRASESDRKNYREKFLENFNSAVTANALKWPNMEPRRGEMIYAVVDSMLEWTEKHKLPLRGHNLFWGIRQFIQPWVLSLPDNELEATIRNRAETVSAKYKGCFAEYDLNNEMIHGNYYEEKLGSDITLKMEQWVHNGDPGANLYLNDYDILTGNKLAEYMSHIRLLLKQGVKIAGIGVQGHLHADTFDRFQLRRALDSLAQFKLPIRVTEFNIPGQRSKYCKDPKLKMTPAEEEKNAGELADYYRICFAHPAVEGILMWGFWEGSNWIPASSMYRQDWSITPNGTAYKNLLFKEWWTKTTGKSDRRGEYSTPAFYGKYKITADGKSKVVNLSKTAGKVVVEF